MSFVMNALCSYRAVLGLNNSRFSTMQNNQNTLANLRNAPSFSGGAILNADKKFALNQATNNLNAQVFSVELDSLEKATKRQVEGFNYFA